MGLKQRPYLPLPHRNLADVFDSSPNRIGVGIPTEETKLSQIARDGAARKFKISGALYFGGLFNLRDVGELDP